MKTIDEAAIRRLASNPAAVSAFSFLSLKIVDQKRSCCGRRQKTESPDYARIKLFIARLTPDKHSQILDFLGIQNARLVCREGSKVLDITMSRLRQGT